MTEEQIIEIAKSCGFQELTEEKDEIDDEYWGCWEEQLLKFAQQIFEMGRESASPDGVY